MASTQIFTPETLRCITDKANHMSHITSSKQVPVEVSRPEVKVHEGRTDPEPTSFSLPPPPSLVPKLLELGLSSADAATVDQHSGPTLKEIYEREMRTTMRHWIQTRYEDDIHARLQSVHQFYTSRYFVALDQWHNAALAAVRSRTLSRTPAPRHEEPKRSGFDQGALSILETAFEKDAYPTRDMKIQIAAQTGIEHKQVNVWFQNRRNRSKKQHKELRSAKFKHGLAGSIIIFSPQCTLYNDDSPPPTGHDGQISPKSASADELGDIATARPGHAFPSPYPPVCSYEPFPICNLSFEIPWPRRRTIQAPESDDAPIEVDQLTLAFAKLTTVDPMEAQEPTPVRPKRQRAPGSSTCYGFTIVPPKAPLPALVPAMVTVTSTRSPTPSHRITIVDSQISSKRTPRRSNKRTALARDSAHPYHPSSRHTSSSSRSSSTSSASSMSSTTSLSSSPDSPLCTPPTPHADLPHVKS